MPQTVEDHLLPAVRDPGIRAEGVHDLRGAVGHGHEYPAPGRRKHQATRPRSPALLEHGLDPLRHEDMARLSALGVPQGQHLPAEVNVIPRQVEEFAGPQPALRGEQGHVSPFEPFLQRGKQIFRLLHGQAGMLCENM